ncbi:hypothetical protein [Methanobacterium sp.]|uniref:hypothetical protein n=1 Tax=Methanobacterium sp. TaxID=2164 RepID=UPI003C71D297
MTVPEITTLVFTGPALAFVDNCVSLSFTAAAETVQQVVIIKSSVIVINIICL